LQETASIGISSISRLISENTRKQVPLSVRGIVPRFTRDNLEKLYRHYRMKLRINSFWGGESFREYLRATRSCPGSFSQDLSPSAAKLSSLETKQYRAGQSNFLLWKTDLILLSPPRSPPSYPLRAFALLSQQFRCEFKKTNRDTRMINFSKRNRGES
jgi:hypothetical protein